MSALIDQKSSSENPLQMNAACCTLDQVNAPDQGECSVFKTPKIDVSSFYRLLTKKEVAEMMGCTERTVDRLVACNQIPFTKIPWGTGGKLKRRFIFGVIAEWLERHSPDKNAGSLMHQNAEDN